MVTFNPKFIAQIYSSFGEKFGVNKIRLIPIFGKVFIRNFTSPGETHSKLILKSYRILSKSGLKLAFMA